MQDRQPIKILDCTLRDGGYVNNWDFGKDKIIGVINSLVRAKVDIIETGYISSIQKPAKNFSTQFNSVQSIEAILRETELADLDPASRPTCVMMLNRGEVDVDSFPECGPDSWTKGIRYAFHRTEFKETVKEVELLMNKGYEVFVQPMVTLSYKDQEILELIELYRELKPYAFYIVDSFGAMSTGDMERIFHLVDHNLPSEVPIGFHSHNNLQLAYANARTFSAINSNRALIVDTSILGMGRGAGNLCTEIFADYLNKDHQGNYQILPLMEVIDNHLEAIYKSTPWGYSSNYFLSGAADCHPNYATHFSSKRTLTVGAIFKILEQMDEGKKVSFDAEYAEDLYLDYQSTLNARGNSQAFPLEKDVMIIAGGSSVTQREAALSHFYENHEASSIAINHLPAVGFNIDYIFFSNQKRYNEFAGQITAGQKIILTSNIVPAPHHQDFFVIDYRGLYVNLGTHSDNATILLMEYLAERKIPEVFVAGLDGYSGNPSASLSHKGVPHIIDKKLEDDHNTSIATALEKLGERISIRLLTPSLFQQNCPLKILGVIPARYPSTRFDGKPLAMIDGIPMIKRTWMQAMKAEGLEKVVVATDDQRIFEYCKGEDIPVVMTSDRCLTGTDRVAEVAKKMSYDLYLNIQGDEPVIDPRCLQQVIDSFLEHGDAYPVYNLYKEISDDDEVQSPATIKVMVSEKGELVYMSRTPIPYNKSNKTPTFNKQVCVYGFTGASLDIYTQKNEKGINEQYEDIEILRFLDRGHPVKMIKTDYSSIAVDIPEDVPKVEAFLKDNPDFV